MEDERGGVHKLKKFTWVPKEGGTRPAGMVKGNTYKGVGLGGMTGDSLCACVGL